MASFTRTNNVDPETGKPVYLMDGNPVPLSDEEAATYSQMAGVEAPTSQPLIRAEFGSPGGTDFSLIKDYKPSSPFIDSYKAHGIGGAPAVNAPPVAEAPMAPAAPQEIPPMIARPPVTSAIVPAGTTQDLAASGDAFSAPMVADETQFTPTNSGMGKITETTLTQKDTAEADKKLAASVQKQQEAMDAKNVAEQAIANNEAISANAQAVEAQKFIDEEATKQKLEQADIAERQARLDGISADYSNMKIDSNKFWADKSTGDSIMIAISMALGGMAQMGGATNDAFGWVTKAIDKDIEVQKANMAKAGDNVSQQRGLFSDVMKRTGDERLARLKTHEMALNAMKAQYDAISAQSKSPLIQANTDKDKAILDQALATNKQQQDDVLVTVSKTAPLSAGKPGAGAEADDVAFAKKANEWEDETRPTLSKGISSINLGIRMIEKDPSFVSGRIQGNLPELMRSKYSKDIQRIIDEAGVEKMRATLGSQFTEKEGKMMRGLLYDPTLDPDQNLAHLKRVIETLDKAQARMDAKVNFYRDNGRSLAGWKQPKDSTDTKSSNNFKPK